MLLEKQLDFTAPFEENDCKFVKRHCMQGTHKSGHWEGFEQWKLKTKQIRANSNKSKNAANMKCMKANNQSKQKRSNKKKLTNKKF